MKRYDHLFEKIVTFDNLLLAAKKAARGKKDKRAVSDFLFHLENEIISLQEELVSGNYRPRPYTLFEIREPKVRKICSSEFRDRVVHHAICNFVEPVLERKAIHDSYACRVGKGAHKAVLCCQGHTQRFKYFLKCDIRKFFETIEHQCIKVRLRRIFKDKKLLDLMDIIIDHAVPGNIQGRGLPIGNLTSQHFANYLMGELDHFIKDRQGIKGYVRYMDDFISFSDDKASLHLLLEKVDRFVKEEIKLELKPKATLIAPVTQGISFLGFRVYPHLIRLKRENLIRLRKTVRKKENLYMEGRIKEIDLTRSMSSVIGHVSHVNSTLERRRIFEKSLSLAE